MSDESLPSWFILLKERFDRQDRQLERIEQKTTETNGRVTANEVKVAALEASWAGRSKLVRQIWFACSASAGLGVLVIGVIQLVR